MQALFHSPKFRSQLEKVAWITFFWILISISQFLTGYSTLLDLNFEFKNLSPLMFFTGSIITGLIAGTLGGSLIVFYWEHWLRTKSYRWSLLNMFWSYTLIFIIVSLLTNLFFQAREPNEALFHPNAWNLTWNNMFSFPGLNSYITWLVVVILTLIALLVNDKYGPGVFVSFLKGKYFHPQREERIFMFLDLRSSTTIAEKLGERLYFNFLKDVFRDATPAILNSKGEIYQYVGDEIVVTWKKESGAENANCLQCFFDIQKRFLNKVNYYKEKYDGIKPEFKAGLHYGFVMVGEIGIVKRDIAYSGDVLNTTARIQSKCNELGVNILLSKYLLDKLGLLPNLFNPKEIGEITLRGKQQEVMLYTV